ncbi:MAG: GDP-mannose 4,6-dehydratase [Patescibacteria group bacterium]
MLSIFKKFSSKSFVKTSRKTPILITGGTGFAGSHLVERLSSLGYSQVHVTSFANKSSYVHTLIPKENIHKIDLTDKKAVFSLIKKIKPRQIYHLAAISEVGKSFDQASKIINNNTALQLNLLEAIRQIVPKSRILAVGSALEYDFLSFKATGKNQGIQEDHPLGPANPYAVSKVSQDLLSLSYYYSYALDVVRVRPFNHIGERQAMGFVLSDFAQQIIKCKSQNEKCKISVGNLKAIRDFTDVKDVVRAYILLMEKGKSGEVYNVGSGIGRSMREVLDMLIDLSGSKVKVEIDKKKFRPLDVPRVIADNRKIASLGWKAGVPIQETLVRVLNYWRNL